MIHLLDELIMFYLWIIKTFIIKKVLPFFIALLGG